MISRLEKPARSRKRGQNRPKWPFACKVAEIGPDRRAKQCIDYCIIASFHENNEKIVFQPN